MMICIMTKMDSSLMTSLMLVKKEAEIQIQTLNMEIHTVVDRKRPKVEAEDEVDQNDDISKIISILDLYQELRLFSKCHRFDRPRPRPRPLVFFDRLLYESPYSKSESEFPPPFSPASSSSSRMNPSSS